MKTEDQGADNIQGYGVALLLSVEEDIPLALARAQGRRLTFGSTKESEEGEGG